MSLNVTDLVALAMSKKLKADAPPPGEYVVSGLATVRVNVRIAKGEPTMYRPTSSLPLKGVLAVALRRAGVMRGNIARIIAEAATEALEAGEKVEGLEETEEAIKAVEKMLERLPPKSREGATRVEGDVELLGFAPELKVVA